MTDDNTCRYSSLGIYGGTFSPPHIAHISVVKAFINQLLPDKLFIVPAGIPPHKSVENDDRSARLEMTKAAFQPVSEKICISDYELTKAGKSYTSDTLRHFSSMTEKLYLVCGGDMFLTLDSWHEPATIFKLATIVYTCRGGIEDDEYIIRENQYREKYGASIISLKMNEIDMSSTDLREIYRSGGDISEFVTPETLEIIKRRGLYT